MKKIICIIQVIALCLSVSIWTYAAEYPFSDVFVEIASENTANSTVFFDGDRPGFSVQLKNPENKAYLINLSYTVYDLSGSAVWSSSAESFVLGKKAVIVKNVAPVVSNYGVYTLKAVLTGAFGTIEKEQSFAIAARNDKRDDFIGTNTHFSHYEYFGYEKEEITNYLLQNGGFGFIRDDHSWWQAETGKTEEKYVFPEYREANIDNMLAAGNKLLINVAALNPLYDDYTLVYSEDGIKAYAEYCGALAEYYRGRIDTFEICNEPDHEKYAGRNAGGDEYAKILKAARDAIKNVDESITVVGGALCSYLNAENREFLQEFAAEIKANGTVFDYMDIFSFHPYNTTGEYSDEETDYTFLQNVGYVKQQLGTEIPIWISEYGIPNCEADTAKDRDWGYTETEQAAGLVRTITAAKSDAQISNFSIYNFRQKHTDDDAVERGYGIVDGFYNAKPAFVALSFANRVLKDAEYVAKLANEDYYGTLETTFGGKSNRAFDAYRFKRGEEDIFALWEHTGKTAALTITQSSGVATGIAESGSNVTITADTAKTVEIRDMYGNLIDGNSVELTDEPVYVICRPAAVAESTENKFSIKTWAKKPFAPITLMAVSRGEFAERIIAIEQTISDENGKYAFDVKIPSDTYWFYVTENGERESFGKAPAYDISTVYKEVDGKMNAEITVTDNTDSGEKLLLFGAVYEKSGQLRMYDVSESLWNNKTATLTVELDTSGEENSSKLMLWNGKYNPITRPLMLGQEE